MDNNKIYLILGASSDIGCELIHQLNQDCSDAVFLAHYRTCDSNIKKNTPINGNKIVSIKADLSIGSDIISLIKDVDREYGAPTHIVHLPASEFEYTRVKDMDWDKFCIDLYIQVFSLIEILKAFIPIMVKRKSYNKIVMMLSSYTISSPPKFTMSYTMVKHTLLGLMKSLASDYNGKKININAISPSMIETKFLDNVDSRIIEMNAKNSVGNTNARVSDVVPAVKFLLSEDSNYINGINLNISNGNVI